MTNQTYSNLQDLAGLTRHEGIDARPTLLRVLTDLYVQQPTHTLEEEKHFTELALRLIDEVDIPSKTAMAKRLADYRPAPLAVLRRLAADLGEVADPRPAASESDRPTGGIENSERESGHHFEANQGTVALGELFFAASSAERGAILRDLALIESPPPPIRLQDRAEAVRRLETAALQGRPYEFVREIERSLAIPRQQAERIVNDATGEPLLMIAKALATPIDVLQRMLLLVNPAIGTSVRRVFDLSALYENLSMSSALHLVALWSRPGARRRETEPVIRPSESSDDRRAPIGGLRSETVANPVLPRRDQRAS